MPHGNSEAIVPPNKNLWQTDVTKQDNKLIYMQNRRGFPKQKGHICASLQSLCSQTKWKPNLLFATGNTIGQRITTMTKPMFLLLPNERKVAINKRYTCSNGPKDYSFTTYPYVLPLSCYHHCHHYLLTLS